EWAGARVRGVSGSTGAGSRGCAACWPPWASPPRDPGLPGRAHGSERRAWRAGAGIASGNGSARGKSADCGDFISFAGRPDGEEFLPRTQSRIFRSPRMAGTAAEQGARPPRHYGKAGGAGRKRTAFQRAGAKREIAGGRKTGMNRSRQLNRVGAASLARWIVITALLAAAGLCYVYLSLQLHRLGDQKKALETEL